MSTTEQDKNMIIDLTKPIVYEDICRKEVPVKLGGTNYILKEGSAGAVKAYRNALITRASFDDKGKVTKLGGIADTESVLVAGCLFKVIPNGLHAVTLAEVEELPYYIIQDLFSRAKAMTRGLDEKHNEEAAKKLPNGTQATSS
jgi:hypothetical protein